MLKNSTLTQLDHIFHLKSYNTLLMLVVLFCFFQKLMRRTTALATGLTTMKRGERWRFLWWRRWAVRKAAMRTMVEIPQKLQNTPSIAFNGRVGEWKQLKKNLTRLIRKISPQELKRESYPGLLGNLLLDAHLLKFSRVGNNAEKIFFSN